MLTVNLCFKLNLGVSRSDIDNTLRGAGTLGNANAWTLPVFREWFHSNFRKPAV